MQQLVKQTVRSTSQTTDLVAPASLSAPVGDPVPMSAPAAPSDDGHGTFGVWVEQHHIAVGVAGMVFAAGLVTVPGLAAATLKLGPIVSVLSWMAGQELVKRQRGAEADVAGSLALGVLGAAVIAAFFSG
ncbi:MAG: hypothetical protein H7338_13040 [Candidatus Sericytochromatia bacterium]|nr:hypothetical protein [Candidatus Sericytochromatia bacterium]